MGSRRTIINLVEGSQVLQCGEPFLKPFLNFVMSTCLYWLGITEVDGPRQEESSSDALSWDTQNQENGLKEALTHQWLQVKVLDSWYSASLTTT